MLRNAVFVSDDAISNYGHVWYVSDRIWRFHHFPWSMPVIGHGKALAFPYALVPWLSAALLRPILGDWVVTLWLVVGTVGLIAATFWAFPELRRGWWAAAVLVADGRVGVLPASAFPTGSCAGRTGPGGASGGRPADGCRTVRLVVTLQ